MGKLKPVTMVIILGVVGCGDDAGAMSDGGVSADGASACPVLAGTWTIASHCNTAFVGMQVAVTQAGCSLTTSGTFAGFSGTVTQGGALSIAGSVSGASIMCTGMASAQHWTQDCTGSCAVTLTR